MYTCEHTHTPSLLEHRHQKIKYTDSPESQIHFHKVHAPKFMLFNHWNTPTPTPQLSLHPGSLTLHSVLTGLVSWFLSPQQTEGSNYAGKSEKGLQRRGKKKKPAEICQHSPPPERNSKYMCLLMRAHHYAQPTPPSLRSDIQNDEPLQSRGLRHDAIV